MELDKLELNKLMTFLAVAEAGGVTAAARRLALTRSAVSHSLGALEASLGVALFPEDGDDAETLLKNADAAMYAAKELGRNSFRLYSPELAARLIGWLMRQDEPQVSGRLLAARFDSEWLAQNASRPGGGAGLDRDRFRMRRIDGTLFVAGART